MKDNDQSATAAANPKRNKYSPQFKKQVLARAKQDDIPNLVSVGNTTQSC